MYKRQVKNGGIFRPVLVDGDEVEDRFAALEKRVEAGRVRDVAVKHRGGRPIHGGGRSVGLNVRDHLVAVAREVFAQMIADETVGAGDADFHAEANRCNGRL